MEMSKCGKFFLIKKDIVRKGYYGNENFSLARDRIEVLKIVLRCARLFKPKSSFP